MRRFSRFIFPILAPLFLALATPALAATPFEAIATWRVTDREVYLPAISGPSARAASILLAVELVDDAGAGATPAYCDPAASSWCAPGTSGAGQVSGLLTTLRAGGGAVVMIEETESNKRSRSLLLSSPAVPTLSVRKEIAEAIDFALEQESTATAEYLRGAMAALSDCSDGGVQMPFALAQSIEVYLGCGTPTDAFRGLIEMVQNAPACS